MNEQTVEGILLVDKPKGRTSFSLIPPLRKILNETKIGHAGTLDPLATGVMVFLVGRGYTKKSNEILARDKEYLARVQLGIATDSYDADGQCTHSSSIRPTLEEVEYAIQKHQGKILQTPPMFSAKKIGGKKLYLLARKGQVIDRPAQEVEVCITLLDYSYPSLSLRIQCSKGTYIRCLAHEIGKELQCWAHLRELRRTRSGDFHIDQCLAWDCVSHPSFYPSPNAAGLLLPNDA